MATAEDAGGGKGMGGGIKSSPGFVIGASSVGSVFEWYDFFLYGTLLPFINRHFYTGLTRRRGISSRSPPSRPASW